MFNAHVHTVDKRHAYPIINVTENVASGATNVERTVHVHLKLPERTLPVRIGPLGMTGFVYGR
jgi:hypothetical protein